ncbi:MAG: J domain-containing protein [Chthoniobacter sp.]
MLVAGRCLALDITTREGATYRHCEVTKVEPDGIVISSADGIARIPFEEMPAALQAQYHLDAAQVAEYRNRLKDAQARPAKRMAGEWQKPTAAPAAKPGTPVAANRRPALEPATSNDEGDKNSDALSQVAQLGMFLALSVVGLVISIWIGRKFERAQRWKRVCAESDQFLSLLEEGHAIPTRKTHVLLLDDERAYYCAPTSLYETRAVRHYQSSHAGFRVAKGVWMSGSQGYSVSSQEWTLIDSGTLTVTNRRLVFDGAKETRALMLRRIVAVESLRDSVALGVENRQKRMVFSAANPLILASIIGISCRALEMSSRGVPEPDATSGGFEQDRTGHTVPPPREPPPRASEKKQRRRSSPPPKVESEEVSHGRVLGLSGKVTFADIKRQYRQRMLEYHPDKVAALGSKLRALAEEESKKINAAYAFFSDRYAPRGR